MDNHNTPAPLVDHDDLITDIALGVDHYSQRGETHPALADPDVATQVAELQETLAIAQSARGIRTSSGPSEQVWAKITAEIDDSESQISAKPDAVVHTLAPRTSARRKFPIALGAAAAGLVVGVAAGALLWPAGKSADQVAAPQPTVTVSVTSTPAVDIEQAAKLATLDTKTRQGTAELVNTAQGLRLLVNTKAFDPGSGYLEVWLINQDKTRMVSVGVLPTGGSNVQAAFPVDRELINQGYTIVDISQEEFDDQPAHSGKSLVRGGLQA